MKRFAETRLVYTLRCSAAFSFRLETPTALKRCLLIERENVSAKSSRRESQQPPCYILHYHHDVYLEARANSRLVTTHTAITMSI